MVMRFFVFGDAFLALKIRTLPASLIPRRRPGARRVHREHGQQPFEIVAFAGGTPWRVRIPHERFEFVSAPPAFELVERHPFLPAHVKTTVTGRPAR
jgi:hypothetical protein